MAVVSPGKTAFLKYEIEHGDARRKKLALQDISRLYRQGYVLRADNRGVFEQLINGIVLSDPDEKVVRWCLNALAQFGTRDGSSRYVQYALQANEGNPEIIAAAVAALAKIFNGRLEEVRCLSSVDPAIRTLAAMQNTDPRRLDLSGLKIKIDVADAEVLKLALITVGLNKDVENLFDPRHSNGQIVNALGQYPDAIVRQYSVWCVLENRRLTIADLGIPFEKLEREPGNVQAKLLQLAAEKLRDQKEKHEIIYKGSCSEHVDARAGLAKGLLQSYYDGLEEITVGWFDTEQEDSVKGFLAEHFARFSDAYPPYSDKAKLIAETESGLKGRVLLGAEGTHLWTALQRRDARDGIKDLFDEALDLGSVLHGAPLVSKEKTLMKALMLAAAPKNEKRLRLDEEARDLQEQLKLVDNPVVEVRIDHRWAVRSNQLQAAVMNVRPQILHFSGHGDHGLLVFEDQSGCATEVPAEAIAELVELNRSVECLILNACYSDSIAKLAAPHLKAVIGCNSTIDDDAAIAFSRAFYRALAHGESYERAYRLAKNEVRINGFGAEADKFTFAP